MRLTLKANGFEVRVKPFAEWQPEWAEGLKRELLEEFEAGRE